MHANHMWHSSQQAFVHGLHHVDCHIRLAVACCHSQAVAAAVLLHTQAVVRRAVEHMDYRLAERMGFQHLERIDLHPVRRGWSDRNRLRQSVHSPRSSMWMTGCQQSSR